MIKSWQRAGWQETVRCDRQVLNAHPCMTKPLVGPKRRERIWILGEWRKQNLEDRGITNRDLLAGPTHGRSLILQNSGSVNDRSWSVVNCTGYIWTATEFLNLSRYETKHQCDREISWLLMTLRRNKMAIFNVVFDLSNLTYWTSFLHKTEN
jgi:hypothetical protein